MLLDALEMLMKMDRFARSLKGAGLKMLERFLRTVQKSIHHYRVL